MSGGTYEPDSQESALIMNLDWQICSRARVTRDARFDGKFFIAVLSTKIYCRPICPVRLLKESSVRYYPSAAAGRSGLSSLPPVPSGKLPGNSRVAGNFKHGFARFAADW